MFDPIASETLLSELNAIRTLTKNTHVNSCEQRIMENGLCIRWMVFILDMVVMVIMATCLDVGPRTARTCTVDFCNEGIVAAPDVGVAIESPCSTPGEVNVVLGSQRCFCVKQPPFPVCLVHVASQMFALVATRGCNPKNFQKSPPFEGEGLNPPTNSV